MNGIWYECIMKNRSLLEQVNSRILPYHMDFFLTFLSEYWFSGDVETDDEVPPPLGLRKPLWSLSLVTSTRRILIKKIRLRIREIQTGIVTNIW